MTLVTPKLCLAVAVHTSVIGVLRVTTSLIFPAPSMLYTVRNGPPSGTQPSVATPFSRTSCRTHWTASTAETASLRSLNSCNARLPQRSTDDVCGMLQLDKVAPPMDTHHQLDSLLARLDVASTPHQTSRRTALNRSKSRSVPRRMLGFWRGTAHDAPLSIEPPVTAGGLDSVDVKPCPPKAKPAVPVLPPTKHFQDIDFVAPLVDKWIGSILLVPTTSNDDSDDSSPLSDDYSPTTLTWPSTQNTSRRSLPLRDQHNKSNVTLDAPEARGDRLCDDWPMAAPTRQPSYSDDEDTAPLPRTVLRITSSTGSSHLLQWQTSDDSFAAMLTDDPPYMDNAQDKMDSVGPSDKMDSVGPSQFRMHPTSWVMPSTTRCDDNAAKSPLDHCHPASSPFASHDANGSGPTVEIAPGHVEPLRGTDETMLYVATDATSCRRYIDTNTCWTCATTIHCIADAAFVVCPMCRTMQPTPRSDHGAATSGASQPTTWGVGLGFVTHDWDQWKEVLMQ